MDALEVAGKPVILAPAGMGSTLPHTVEQAQWARCRPLASRTRIPDVGERVLYRHRVDEPFTEAEVYRVDMGSPRDHFVYRHALDSDRKPVVVSGRHVMELVDDPWPDVYLITEYGRIVTREARIPGSEGYILKES